MKRIICWIEGHKLEDKSIVRTISSNNWLKKCSRCGQYVMHGDIGSVCISEKSALKIKANFEKEFPYSVEKGGVTWKD